MDRLRDFVNGADESCFAPDRVPRTDFSLRQIGVAKHERRQLNSRHRERLNFSPVFAGVEYAVGEEKEKLRRFWAGSERLKRPEEALPHRSGAPCRHGTSREEDFQSDARKGPVPRSFGNTAVRAAAPGRRFKAASSLAAAARSTPPPRSPSDPERSRRISQAIFLAFLFPSLTKMRSSPVNARSTSRSSMSKPVRAPPSSAGSRRFRRSASPIAKDEVSSHAASNAF